MDHFFMTRPHMGSMSVNWMPGTAVDLTPNSPRYSTGALGLGSHMSMWLGPPRIQRMMTHGSRPPLVERDGADASSRSRSERASPEAPSRPALRKLRRSGSSERWK